jgi:hypothetical protein
MKNYASVDVVTNAFRRVLNQLGDARFGALSWDENRVA